MLSNQARYDTTKLGPNAVQELKINQRRILIDSLEIGIPAPEQMIALGERQLPNGIKVGQLFNSKTLNYKKFTPHRDGLFCERIFGPVQSFVCACGKKKESVQNKSRQKDLVRTKLLQEVSEVEVTSPFQKETLFCPKCQVEYISKNVRRHRLGYIKLFAPVTHIWYLKGRPSYLSLFLGKRKKAVTSLAYCNAYLVEQVYSHLETKNSENVVSLDQAKDTNKSVSESFCLPSKQLTKFKQKQSSNKEPFFHLLEQLFPEKSVKKLSFNSQKKPIKNQNVNIKDVFFNVSQLYKNEVFVGQPYSLTKRYKAVTKLASWLKLPVQSEDGLTKTSQKQSFCYKFLLNPVRSFAHAKPCLYKNHGFSDTKTKFLLSPYVRAQTSPFLPSLICSFHLRDCLISFLQSSPRTEDIPIPLYCQTLRRYPLRDVHKFLTEFRSTTTKEKAEKLTSESIKKFIGLPKQAKPVLNKNEIFFKSYSKTLPNRAIRLRYKNHGFCINKVFTHEQGYVTKNIVFCNVTDKKPGFDVESFSAYARKPNVTTKRYNRSNTFTRLKVSTLAVNLEKLSHVSIKKANFLQKVIGDQRNKDTGKNGKYRQLSGLTKQSENLLMPIQFLARKTTMSGMLLNTFIDILSLETASMSNKNQVFVEPNSLPVTLQKNSQKLLQKLHKNRVFVTSFCIPSFALSKTKQPALVKNLVTPFVRNVLFDKNSVKTKTNKQVYSRYFGKTRTHNALVKAKFLPMHYQTKHKDIFDNDFLNFQLTAAVNKFRNQAKLCKGNVLFTNIETYQTRLLHFVFGTLPQSQSTESSESVTKPKESKVLLPFYRDKKVSSSSLFAWCSLDLRFAFVCSLFAESSLRFCLQSKQQERTKNNKKEQKQTKEQFLPYSRDLVKSKLIAGLSSNQNRIEQHRNIYFQVYSSHPCNILVTQKSEKGVTFLSRSRLNFVRKIGSNGVFSVSFSINLPSFLSGPKQNKVCEITKKENQVEWTTFGEGIKNDPFALSKTTQRASVNISSPKSLVAKINTKAEFKSSRGENTLLTSYAPYANVRKLSVGKYVKSQPYKKADKNKINIRTDNVLEYNIGQKKQDSISDCSVRSTAFISSSLPDVGVWSCTLVKKFLINSSFYPNVFSQSERVRLQKPSFCNNLLSSKQKPFAQSTKVFTNTDRVKANVRSSVPVFSGFAKQSFAPALSNRNEVSVQRSSFSGTQTISKWHINGAKEILSYTGGGALESLLKRFNISLFCQFLFGEIQILRKYYKDQIVAEYNKSNISDERSNSFSQGLNEYAYLQKNEVDPAFYVPKRSSDLVKIAVPDLTKTVTKTLPKQGFDQDSYSVGPERHFGLKHVVTDKNTNLFCRRIYRTTRRLKIVQLLMRSKRRPEWMMISVLPVLPPDLRPVLQMGENLIVASDLNTLYQRVIYRNNRHYKGRFLDFHFVSSIHRLVQDAVDRLIENGKGGSTPFLTPGGRPLKSLSDILKGKRGRFRFNLLGKRVDFSGRSVIVVSPNLKIHECGLPREMALELYKYLLIRQLLLKKHVSSIVNAKKLIKQRKPLIWDMLREIIYYHPLLLNRAPTLHRLGIQAFQPKLALGNAILLHPLVCAGFNADFDGDQMGVHLPLSPQARAEAWDLLWSRNNLLSPATGQPILLPSQDMVLGFYYMTALLPYGTTFRSPNEDDQRTRYNNNVLQNKVLQPPVVHVFSNTFQVVNAYQKKQIDIHTPIWLKRIGKSENGEKNQIPLELRIDIFGYRTQIYPTYKSKSKVLKDKNTSFLTFYEKKASEHIRTTVGRVLVNNLISQSN